MANIVNTHTKASLRFKARLFSIITMKTVCTMVGVSNTTRHVTANIHDETPFKLIDGLFFRRRISLEILNNLKLR